MRRHRSAASSVERPSTRFHDECSRIPPSCRPRVCCAAAPKSVVSPAARCWLPSCRHSGIIAACPPAASCIYSAAAAAAAAQQPLFWTPSAVAALLVCKWLSPVLRRYRTSVCEEQPFQWPLLTPRVLECRALRCCENNFNVDKLYFAVHRTRENTNSVCNNNAMLHQADETSTETRFLCFSYIHV